MTGRSPVLTPRWRTVLTVLVVCFVVVLIAMNTWSMLSLVSPSPEQGSTPEPVDDPIMDVFTPAADRVALGDSTMALSAGQVEDWYQGCRHEKGTWVSQLDHDVTNISCSGADVSKVTRIATSSGSLGGDTSMVYVTVGSNTARQNKSVPEITDQVRSLYDVILSRSPRARVVFVGYLPMPEGSCLSEDQKKVSRWIDGTHRDGDAAMRSVAQSTGSVFVDVRGVRYPACDAHQTYVRLPGTTKGTVWHTTESGHKAVAEKVRAAMSR